MTIGFRIHVQRDFEYEPLPHVYDTKKSAESAWYDGAPGRNDRMELVKAPIDKRSAAINLFWRKLKKCTPEQAHELATKLSAELLTIKRFQVVA
jgi:hypothetical protein